ncbi:MAG TPA: ACT domain-containing protein [Patescibacteria group bacterium]|nr:ACT domain-containing protein [Patescibacteria group bacterium]
MLDVIYTLLLEVRDQPGVLVRVAQVFARRGCNISSVHVEHPANTQWSHMKITVKNVARPDQVISQLEKLVDVHSVAVQTKVKEV